MENNKFKIAIYSGEIPSTVFIENIIIGLSNSFEIHLYGTLNRKVKYNTKNIRIFSVPNSKFKRVIYLLINMIKVFIFDISKFFKYLKKLKDRSFKKKIICLEKILPIIINKPDLLHFQWPISIKYFDVILDDFITIVSLRGRLVNIVPFVYPEIMNYYSENFKKIDAFHSVSSDMRKISRSFIGEEKHIRVIRPAVNKKLIESSNKEWTYKINKPLKIISIGGNRWKKGFTYALDAMRILHEENFSFIYTLIAPGFDTENIKYQIDDLGLSSCVNFIPGMVHEDALNEIKENHLFLLSSISEGIANVVLEAMALGIPVISTDCDGMDEVITDNYNGFLIQTRSPKIIAEKIMEFKNMELKDVNEIIKNGKEKILSNHLLETQVDELKSLYLDVLNEINIE